MTITVEIARPTRPSRELSAWFDLTQGVKRAALAFGPENTVAALRAMADEIERGEELR